MRKRTRKDLLVMLDYDGTLVPIARRPGLARLSPARKRLLARLCRAPGVCVAAVTGRSLPDIRKLLSVPGLILAANHGFEIRAGKKTFHPRGVGCRRNMERLAEAMSAALGFVPGAIVEPKGFSVAVHYRLSPRGRWGEIERAVRRISLPYRRRFGWMVTSGKRLWEVRPALHWNKGDVALWLWKRFAPGAAAIYVGDDETDEDAFRALRGSGLTVAVGRPRSAALCAARDVRDVWRFLREIVYGATR